MACLSHKVQRTVKTHKQMDTRVCYRKLIHPHRSRLERRTPMEYKQSLVSLLAVWDTSWP
jgi:hypothetical protein